MTEGTIQNRCPPMRVSKTSRLGVRMTAELVTRGEIVLDGATLPFTLTFPATPVRKLAGIGKWLVDSVTANGFLDNQAGRISVTLSPERVHRAGSLMIAEAVEATGFVVLADGRVGDIEMVYPAVAADPGPFFGFFYYTVRAVTADGTVTFK